MTRKDYIMLLSAFLAARRDIANKEPPELTRDLLDGVSYAAEHVAKALQADNYNFEYDCFLSAAGVPTR